MDPLKAARNLAKHGVSFEEAATVFGDPLGRIESDPRHSVDEKRSVLLGVSEGGRLLAVMFAERGEAVRLVNARRRHLVSGETMKREQSKVKEARRVDVDEILPEYDFLSRSTEQICVSLLRGQYGCSP